LEVHIHIPLQKIKLQKKYKPVKQYIDFYKFRLVKKYKKRPKIWASR